MPEETVGDTPAEDVDASEDVEETSADSGDGSGDKAKKDKAPEKQPAKAQQKQAPPKKSGRPATAPAKPQEEPTRPQIRRLARSIGMAMPSDRYRIFLGHGAIPPVIERKHFVARLRKLDRIEVVILEGDDEKASGNEFVGEIGLSNVKLREDGRSEIEIEYSLDEKGILTVTISDRIGRIESHARFLLPQFASSMDAVVDVSGLPVEELSEKINLLEDQMKLLKGELTVRRERE
jgi:molecular chaperone DnaK (HSP70)